MKRTNRSRAPARRPSTQRRPVSTGTGMGAKLLIMAAVVAAVLNGYCRPDTDVTVKVRGGDLFVRYTSDGMVTLTGGVKQVFEGYIEF